MKAHIITDAENTPAYCTLAPIRLEKKFLFFEKVISYRKRSFNGTARIWHDCRKTTVLSCHRCLINTVVGKNEQHLNID